MGQEEMVSKQAQTSIEIAGFSIPHTFLVGEIAPNCILGSNFLTKTTVEVDIKTNELCLYQGENTKTAPL